MSLTYRHKKQQHQPFIQKDDKGKQKHRASRTKRTPAGNAPKARHKRPNDIRFLLIRQAARLSEENQRIFYTKVIELAEAEKQERETQERLQQVNKNDGRTNSSRTKRDR